MGMRARKVAAEIEGPHIDCDGVRQLAEQITERGRTTFARSFTQVAVAACWKERGVRLLPVSPFCPQLGTEARVIAERFGKAVAARSPEAIAYLVGAAYTSALPATFRASHGVFYTPPAIVERLLDLSEEFGIDWAKARVLDPACGGGAFLVAVASRILRSLKGVEPAFKIRQLQHRLRGFDSDPFGAWLAQTMLTLSAAEVTNADPADLSIVVETRNSLDLKDDDRDQFDLVVGNPPYGKISLTPAERCRFDRSLYGHANLYGLFTDAAIHWTRTGGVIGFVTPTSMLSGLYFKTLRTLLAAEAPPVAINLIEQRQGVFTDVLQETMLAIYRRKGIARGPTVGFIANSGKPTKAVKRETFALPSRSEAPWLLPRSPGQSLLVRRLWSMPHRLADYGYHVSTGPLVWNRHKGQFSMTPREGSLPVIWAESVLGNGTFEWRSAKRNHAPWITLKKDKDDWLVTTRSCVLLQRTTAKEQSRRLIATELPKSLIRKHSGVVVENHVNMIHSSDTKPAVSAAVIASLLNSAAVDAAFRCINGSVAVSAFELEELPLPAPSVMRRLEVMISTKSPKAKIEALIASAYRISNATAPH
jgi:adenine-specific DNA-methyltransferase